MNRDDGTPGASDWFGQVPAGPRASATEPAAPTGLVTAGGGSDALKARLVEYCASAEAVAKAWKALQQAAREHEGLELELEAFARSSDGRGAEGNGLRNLRHGLRARLGWNLHASTVIDARSAIAGADVVDLAAWARAQCNHLFASLTKERK